MSRTQLFGFWWWSSIKKGLPFLLIGAMVFSQGCCSIFTSSPQTIKVDSKPQGANVTIGPYKGTTPYSVIIPRGKEYIISVKHGNKTETMSLNRSIEPVYWINILFWPGLIIDLATEKMWRYEPTEYTIEFII